jgi:hypothetical protein
MKLTLDNIQAKDLKDTGSFVEKQTPIVHINIGKTFLTTERFDYCRYVANCCLN